MCVMCRDHAQAVSEINTAARGLEEEMEFVSGDKSLDAAKFTHGGHSPQTIRLALLDVGTAAPGQHGGARAAESRLQSAESAKAPGGLRKPVAGIWAQPDISASFPKKSTLSQVDVMLRAKSSPARLPIPWQPGQKHTHMTVDEQTPPFMGPPFLRHYIPDDRFAGHGTHAPFTDSGYASGPLEATTVVTQSYHPLQVPGDPDDSNKVAQRWIIDEDAKILYSAATSLDPVCSRRYVQELSHNLYRSLQAQIDPPDWHSISQDLPDLIKTFAAKIGQGGNSQVYLDIMYFIHNRHRWVVSDRSSYALHVRPELTDTAS